MLGPGIVARTLSSPTERGNTAQPWQYHSRSDNHSKAACWALLFDLLRECDVFRQHAASGKVSFAVNHVMVGPINKTLDLVICAVPHSRLRRSRRTFVDLVNVYSIRLTPDEEELLKGLPVLQEEKSDDVSEVLIALEAKACMTDHLGAIPRLHAEILATGFLAKQAAPNCITVSYTLVNAAESFIAPSSRTAKLHRQPNVAAAVLTMLSTAIPRNTSFEKFGYDAVGASAIICRNDGSPVSVVDGPPGLPRSHFCHYDRMMRSVCATYRSKFGNL